MTDTAPLLAEGKVALGLIQGSETFNLYGYVCQDNGGIYLIPLVAPFAAGIEPVLSVKRLKDEEELAEHYAQEFLGKEFDRKPLSTFCCRRINSGWQDSFSYQISASSALALSFGLGLLEAPTLSHLDHSESVALTILKCELHANYSNWVKEDRAITFDYKSVDFNFKKSAKGGGGNE